MALVFLVAYIFFMLFLLDVLLLTYILPQEIE